MEEEKLKGREAAVFWKMTAATGAALVAYVLCNRFLLQVVFKLDASNYLTNMIGTHGASLKNGILNIVHAIRNLILDGELSCILYLPALIVIAITVFIKGKRSVYYMLAWFGLLLCAVVFLIVGFGLAPIRSMYAFALVGAFLFYYILTHTGRRFASLCLAAILVFGLFQAEKSALLISSDQVRYERDLQMAEDIHHEIVRQENASGVSGLPILVLGRYDFDYGPDYLQGEVIGRSCLTYDAAWSTKVELTGRTAAFMRVHGMYHIGVEENAANLDALRAEATHMPSYPSQGWVKVYQDAVIVKLGEPAYTQEP